MPVVPYGHVKREYCITYRRIDCQLRKEHAYCRERERERESRRLFVRRSSSLRALECWIDLQ